MRLIDADKLLKEFLNLTRSMDKVPEEKIHDLITNAPTIKQDKQFSSFAWALIMETAASFEVANYSISDEDAKKSAEGAIKYARDMANKYYTAPQQPKSVADALEQVVNICDRYLDDLYLFQLDSVKDEILSLIERNAPAAPIESDK